MEISHAELDVPRLTPYEAICKAWQNEPARFTSNPHHQIPGPNTYLALHGDGRHIVSLDQVIETMRQTGEDMKSRYKETSQGGLAVNVVEC